MHIQMYLGLNKAFQLGRNDMFAMRSSKSVSQVLVVVFALLTGAPSSATVVTAIDDFVITRASVSASPLGYYEGRSILYRDSFSDSTTPPAGGHFFDGLPGTYSVLGSYPAGAESGGRLTIDSSLGGDYVNAGGGNRILQRSVLRTDFDPASAAGLKQRFHTFAVYGLFDLMIPPVAADGYGISINDGGPAGEKIALDLFVRREFGGAVVVRFQEEDFVDGVVSTLQLDAMDAPIGADQIEFRLERANIATDTITAAYRFWDDGVPLSLFSEMATTRDFFRFNDWACGAFFAEQVVPAPEPSTLALLGLGLVGLAAICRRKQ